MYIDTAHRGLDWHTIFHNMSLYRKTRNAIFANVYFHASLLSATAKGFMLEPFSYRIFTLRHMFPQAVKEK